MINLTTDLINLKDRSNGYNAALKAHNPGCENQWLRGIDGPGVKQQAAAAIDELLAMDERVAALLFATNEIAIHGLNHINTLRIKIPAQLGVISFDEMIAWDFFYAPLTYIRQPLQRMGALCTKILLDTMENNKNIQQVKLKGELIIRASATGRLS